MRHEFSFDTEALHNALKIGVLIAAIFASADFSARQSADLIETAAIAHARKSTPAAAASKPKSPLSLENTLTLLNTKPLFLGMHDVEAAQQNFIHGQKNFLFADLNAMLLSVYASGTPVASYPIVSKGAPGSFFEVPSGLYMILFKSSDYILPIERAHVSSALRLYGNYLIHGMPRGIRIATSTQNYPGTGITLSYDDAQKLFRAASEGMPVLVARDDRRALPTLAYFRKTNLPATVPIIEGAAAIAIDNESGSVLFEKNRNDMYPTASVAKLMTAIIAEESLASSTVITASRDALKAYGNSGGIVAGENFRTDDLLFGLLLPSSNVAGRMFELSQDLPTGRFLSAMNEKAHALGMTHTHFADSSGLDQNTSSSVSDLVKLLQYMYASHPEIMAISRTREHSAVSGGRKLRHIWDNVNWPAGDMKFLGGKAGFTDEAIETMAGIWLVNPSESGARPIAIAILGSHHRVADVRAIIRYIEGQFVYGTILTQNPEKPRQAFSGAAIFEAVEQYLK